METTEVINRNEKSFKKVRRLTQALLALVLLAILYVQQTRVIQFFQWIWANI